MDVAEHLALKFREQVPETFVGDWPLQSPNCVAVRLWDGSSTEDFGEQTLFNPLVLFLFRHEDYSTAKVWCEAAKRMFHKYSDEVIAQMLLSGGIVHLGRDEENMHVFQMSFNIMLRSDS